MTCSIRPITRRILSILLIIAFILMSVPFLSGNRSALALTEADARSQIIRVHMSRLGITDRMDITLASPYELHFGNEFTMRLPQGSEISFMLKGNDIYLYYQGMSLDAGNSISLTRYALGEGSSENGFRRTNFPALYEGDLTLSVVENKIRPILALHVEDYLLGVVPYEMSNSFPLEALKAQTIAARTYAMRKQNPANDYDVVDTTNDQVYKGYLEGNDVVEQAIRETRGVCGFFSGALSQCYYAASNGGQTENVATVWPTRDDYSYYTSIEDPYDVENPASVVRSITISKKGLETAPYSFRKLVATELASELTARGYDTDPQSVQIDTVSDLSVHTPNRDDSSLMTMMKMTVTISGRTRTDSAQGAAATDEQVTTQPSSLDYFSDPDTEEVSLLFAVDDSLDEALAIPLEPSQTPAPPTDEAQAVFMPIITDLPTESPAPTPSPSPTPPPTYGEYTAIEESFTLDLPIFTGVERTLGLDISSNYENEIWSIAETANDYTIEARRFGHGVGMSQRGAQWMASEYHKTYEEILAFYYPGLQLQQYPESDLTLPAEQEELALTPGPAPSPTPRPTLMPATQTTGEGQWYALVTEIDDDSSLNLRATPELNGDILMVLYKNQRLLVLERCQEEGWVKVRTDVIEGYVMEKFITNEDAE